MATKTIVRGTPTGQLAVTRPIIGPEHQVKAALATARNAGTLVDAGPVRPMPGRPGFVHVEARILEHAEVGKARMPVWKKCLIAAGAVLAVLALLAALGYWAFRQFAPSADVSISELLGVGAIAALIMLALRKAPCPGVVIHCGNCRH